MSKLSKV